MTSNKDKHFSIDHLKIGLKEKAVRSAGVTLVAQVIKFILQIGSIAVLARLLDPSDFGLVAMVTVFTGLALILMEGGLSMAIIQRDHITHAQASNLFWINGALGIGLCLLVALIAPIVATVYNEPRLTLVMVAMSITFLIGGLSVQHYALLRRQMRFKVISLIDVLSMAAGIAAAIAAAIGGLSYWALVVGPITTFLTKTIMCWLSTRWVPSMMSRGSGVRPLLNFGVNLTGANVIGYMATNITPFAVGVLGGAQPLGFYNRAMTLVTIPTSQLMPPIMKVMQSALTRVKDDSERLRRVSLSLMTKIAIATMLISMPMFVTADWLVAILLGDGWDQAVTIFRVLSVGAIVAPINNFTVVIMVSVGQANALLKWKLITLSILLTSVLIGSNWGVLGVIVAHSMSGIFLRTPGFLFYSTMYQPIKFRDYVTVLKPVVMSAVVTVLIAMYIREHLYLESQVASVAMFTALIWCVYLGFLYCSKSSRVELKDTFFTIRNLLRAKKNKSSPV